MVPHSRLSIGNDEAEASAQAVRSGQLVDGPQTRVFEQAVADQTGTEWGIATTSGTTALHLALLGLGVGAGDRVALPSYVCVALLHAIRYVGAEPVVVDVDPDTMNIDPDALKQLASSGLKAVIVPHMFGLPAPLDDILALGIPVIEDCALAIGAVDRGRPVGGQGTLGICSFYATKMLTTGEGGMVVGQDPEQEARIRDLRDYDQPEGRTLRFNYKMTEMQAAMGLVQLGRLPSFIERRRQIAECYYNDLKVLDLNLPVDIPGGNHVFYRYVTRTSQPIDHLIVRLEQEGVACRRPVSQPLHRLLGETETSFAGTEAVFDQALSVPIYPSLTDGEYKTVVKVLHHILS